MKLLLNEGSDPTLQDAWGKTAEDTQREEAELPPEITKGLSQTQRDRDRYHLMRIQMAEMISDKASERTCDFFWKKCCPGRRTRKVTPYGAKLQEKPKRPGMIGGLADKTEVLKYFYRKYGTVTQVKGVERTLDELLVGEDEVENFDLFEMSATL